MLIKTDPAVINSYLEDASGFTRGHAARVVIPEKESEIGEFLAVASEQHAFITLAGGRTGVAAGCIPQGGTILSLEHMTEIGPIEKSSLGYSISIQPGVRLEALKAKAQAAGLLYGPDPTERNGTLGGNVATNASGGQCYKYGTTRKHVLGLEAILSTGEKLCIQRGQLTCKDNHLLYPLTSGRTLHCQRPFLPSVRVEKNAAGYFSQPGMDPLDLLIGMDGTLAVITRIQVLLLPAPAGIFTLAVFFSRLTAALECAQLIRNSSKGTPALPGIAPASLEFMDANALNLLRPDFPSLPAAAQAVLLIEQDYPANGEEQALGHWSTFLAAQHIPDSLIWFAQTAKDREQLRKFRHALPEAVNNIVRARKLQKVGTDMAVPADAFSEMYQTYAHGLAASGMDHLIFGHIGECHLHVNVLPKTPEEFDRAKKLYLGFALAAVRCGGTVSAEHGIGKIKHDFLRIMVGEDGFKEMARVKHCFDPALILNRGNIFPEEYLEGLV